jgi:serine-type D-Ala-D-Ala carboxypeptidase (penicillin-binding protein 5/6)
MLAPAMRQTTAIFLLMLASACFATGQAGAASSYIIVDNQSGHILEGRGANEKRQIASITKVATALVVLDMAQLRKLNLNEMVVIPPVALRAGGANPAGLQVGDQLSIRDLLYSALLASDNVSATALAHHCGARLPNPERLSPAGNFVAHMNALARELGMKRTRFLNPTGLDHYTDSSPPHSTAADVARLVRYAYSEPDFPFYVSQNNRTIQVTRGGEKLPIPITITNTNPLLGQDGIDGVKTGRTARAGDCIALSSEQPPEVRRDGETTYVTPRRIIIVLLGSGNRINEGLALTRRGWGLYNQWASQGRKSSRSKML